ncbi:MAG: VWA domain-containing protein [Candidatus Sericytochromatia bacterium]|uniref:VWA domain-containing protein n=1 Tax=Candidatus Tanganyikabacteria bacterium TaxID=2961651 RepID=A0A937X1R5_9BACT|nr:VWA domain-containing protein [Candidatus Tanganyikabacteria bacterium]
MPLEISARLSDSRIDAGAAESQRMLYVALSAPVGTAGALPLNLGLVLDKSGSMHGVALDCVRAAASHIVRNMSERDTVTVVAFNDEPELVVPHRIVTDPAIVEGAVNRLKAGGGTCMDAGMDMALKELRKSLAPKFLAEAVPAQPGLASVNRILVLTDGHNQHGDDQRCIALAKKAVKENVTFSTFGIGEKFSVDVLREVANAGNGMLHHVASARHIEEAFLAEFKSVKGVGATRVRLRVRLADGVELGTRDPICMVSPSIVVQDHERDGSLCTVNLGDLPADGPAILLVTLYAQGKAAGSHDVAWVEAVYEDAAGTGIHQPLPIAAEWTTSYVPHLDDEVQKAVARMAIYKQRQKAIAVAASNPEMARTMLQSATELAGQAGNEELRTVLQATLTELQRDGRISDRTMIQGEVASRTVLGQ